MLKRLCPVKRRTWNWRRSLSTGLIVGVLSLGACSGGKSEHSTAKSVVTATYDELLERRTARFTAATLLEGAPAGTDLVVEGVFDFTRKVGELHYLPAANQSTRGHMIFYDDTAFIRVDLPELAGQPWLKLPLSESGIMSPDRLIDQSLADTRLRSIGKDQVRGRNATKYTFDKDLVMTDKSALDAEAINPDDVGTLTVGMWLSEEGLPLKIQYLSKIGEQGVSADVASPRGLLTVLEFLEFGVEVNVARPADEQTTDGRRFAEDVLSEIQTR